MITKDWFKYLGYLKTCVYMCVYMGMCVFGAGESHLGFCTYQASSLPQRSVCRLRDYCISNRLVTNLT